MFLTLLKLAETLNLSFETTKQLNKIIDEKIPGRPRFTRQEIVVAGEAFDVYFRDVLECIHALFGDPEFAPYLVFAPERHYADEDKMTRLFHDMHTGRWWWGTQVRSHQWGLIVIRTLIDHHRTISLMVPPSFPSSFHLIRPSSHFSATNPLTPSTLRLVIFQRKFVANLLAALRSFWLISQQCVSTISPALPLEDERSGIYSMLV